MHYLSQPLVTELCEKIIESGFTHCNIIPYQEPSGSFQDYYQDFLEKEYHYDLSYLENLEAKFDIKKIFPEVHSVMVCAHPYLKPENIEALKSSTYKVARYAMGKDYHNVLRSKLKKILKASGYVRRYRIVIDSTPLNERYFARQAELGMIGKNGMLITDQGSFILLAVVLLENKVRPFQNKRRLTLDDDIAATCADCQRCIQACPTDALSASPMLDTKKCISYNTIENKNDTIELENTKKHKYIFGCDICQLVCPHNAKSLFTNESRFSLSTLTQAVIEGSVQHGKEQYFGSPLKRAGNERLMRNKNYVDSINQ